jgi:hypothetical protein
MAQYWLAFERNESLGMAWRIVWMLLVAQLAGCAAPPRGAPAAGSSHALRFQQPPIEAARCFARNAEEHSSALVSEVQTGRDDARVIVRVKNGVTYATADFQRAGGGSRGTVALNVRTTGGASDLLARLVEGC